MKSTTAFLFALPFFLPAYLFSQSQTISGDLTVEGETELQADTEVQGDLKVTGPNSEILFGNDGLMAVQSGYFSGTVGVFWDPQQMAFRAGRAEGTEWAIPWGLYSVGLGYNVKPTGTHSVALNQSTTAGGGSSLATGKQTMAGGDASVSMGILTQAESFASVVLGRYNELLGGDHDRWVFSDPLFVIGNGSAWNNRRNAVTVLKDGRTGIGTSEPEATLHVEGTTRFSGFTQVSGPTRIDFVIPQGDLSMGPFTSNPQ